MTLDEAIRHCEEVSENYRCQRDDAADINDVGTASDCQNCADEHEQLASWLRELKVLREEIGSVKLSNMKEALALIRTLKAELNGWKEDPFSIIAEVCRSVTDCRRCQWYEKDTSLLQVRSRRLREMYSGMAERGLFNRLFTQLLQFNCVNFAI